MDIKTFNDSNFNSKQWINSAWRLSESDNKQEFVATTLSHLQVYKKQLSNVINETLVQLQSQMQTYKKDTRVMATEGSGLHEQLVWLNETVQNVHDKTGNSIDRLQRYDNLISRLENAAKALKEADKWHVLYVNLDKVLEQGVPAIGDQFTELTNDVASVTSTLEVLSESSDYDNKLIQLEDLYNRLESALTPAVITALTQRNKENTKAYCAMFIAMDRHVSLVRLWRRVEAESLQNSNKLDYSIRQLYNDILGHAHSQIEWLTDVLKSKKPLYELIRLYTDLLLALEPSPVKVLTANLKLTSSPEESVNMIIDFKQDMDSFVTNFTKFIETERSIKEDIPSTVYTDLGRAIFAPLREVLPKYVDFQAVILTSQLNIKELNQEDLLEKSRVILSVVERSENWFRTAHNNARKIAANAIYPYFVPSLEAFISALCSIISSTTRQIETDFLSATVRGMAQGVLSPSFPATLILGTAVATLLDRLASLRKEVHEYLSMEGSTDPLQNLELLVLDEGSRACLTGFRSGRESPWSTGADDAKRIHGTLKSLALKILVEPIACQLESIPHLTAWNNNDSLSSDLPDFSISPQEYITVAGQYLMTLPQHLEMHVSEKQTPWQFLNEVCNQTCEMFVEKVLNVRNMDPLGTKRCLSDIVYLSSVVEDLGSNIPNSLKNLENSLRTSINSEVSQ